MVRIPNDIKTKQFDSIFLHWKKCPDLNLMKKLKRKRSEKIFWMFMFVVRDSIGCWWIIAGFLVFWQFFMLRRFRSGNLFIWFLNKNLFLKILVLAKNSKLHKNEISQKKATTLTTYFSSDLKEGTMTCRKKENLRRLTNCADFFIYFTISLNQITAECAVLVW